MKKIIVILISLILLVGCTESNKNKTEYRVEDYVEIVDIETKNTCETEKCKDSIAKIKLKDIKFSNLDDALTSLFLEKHKNLIEVDGKPFVLSDGEEKGFEFRNNFEIYIYGDNLSIFEKSESKSDEDIPYSPLSQSLVINLEKNVILDTRELIELFNLDIEKVYATILHDLKGGIGIKELLKSTTGDTSADTVSIEEYEKNIPEYTKILNQEKAGLILYIKDKDLYSSYNTSDILELLGLGTHNNYELELVNRSVKISK